MRSRGGDARAARQREPGRGAGVVGVALLPAEQAVVRGGLEIDRPEDIDEADRPGLPGQGEAAAVPLLGGQQTGGGEAAQDLRQEGQRNARHRGEVLGSHPMRRGTTREASHRP